MYTDSHAHFDAFAEHQELDSVLQRAVAAGVTRVLAIGGNPAANQLAAKCAAEYPAQLRACVGYDRDLAESSPAPDALRELLNQPGVVAVGETGLDYHYDAQTAAAQIRLLNQMLELARERTVPVVLHSRDAEEDTLKVLKQHVGQWTGDPERIGVLHCFTGTAEFARRLLDLGLYIGFSGIVTFKNAGALREVAAQVPEDRILVETDAPYLAPEPHRGQRNEPAYVVEVARALAKIRHDSVEHIADITSRNATQLFGWK